jgi:hypothetical protein
MIMVMYAVHVQEGTGLAVSSCHSALELALLVSQSPVRLKILRGSQVGSIISASPALCAILGCCKAIRGSRRSAVRLLWESFSRWGYVRLVTIYTANFQYLSSLP